MNAIEMLKDDHRKVQELFRRFETTPDGADPDKLSIAREIIAELERHTKLEEEIFYPAVQVIDEAAHQMVTEAIEEHRVVKQLLADLKAMRPAADDYDAKFTVMAENVRHHVHEEESELMPQAATSLGEAKLKELGTKMAQRKRAMMEPSIVTSTIRQAKTIVTKALDAFTNGKPSPADRSDSGPQSAATTSRRRSTTTRSRRRRVATKVTPKTATSRTAAGSRRKATKTSRSNRAVAKNKRGTGSKKVMSAKGTRARAGAHRGKRTARAKTARRTRGR